MKGILKSFGAVIWFIAMQIIGTVIIVIIKTINDEIWADAILTSLERGDYQTYITTVLEILPYTLILADILILIPIIIKIIYKKEKIISKIKYSEAFFIFSLAISLNTIISLIVEYLPASSTKYYNSLMGIVIQMGFIPMLILSGILAPIIEEFIFRYIMINSINKSIKHNGIKKAVIISSLLFGLAHLNIIQSTYAFMLGIVLGYLYVKNNEFNLLRCMLFHITVNVSSIVYEFSNQVLRLFLTAGIIFMFAFTVFYLVSDKYKFARQSLQ